MENKRNERISFIVPAYNCEATIIESIDSILDTNFNEGDEIIIINDKSTDSTLLLCEALSNDNFEKINVISHKFNKGSAAAARNTGIEAAKNDFVFCLDADNVLEKYSINKLMDFMEEEACDAAAFGEIWFFSESIHHIPKKWILTKDIDFIQNINQPDTTPCSSGNYLYTKNSWMKAGRYNESIGGALDSWGFGVKQITSGTIIKTMPNSHYFHRIGYESTFIKESKKSNLSITALQILLPHLHLIDRADLNKILNGSAIYTWFENIKNAPLKGGSEEDNDHGNKKSYIQEPSFKDLISILKEKLKRKLSFKK